MASDSSNQPVLPNVPTRRPRREDGTGRLDRVRRALFHTLPGRLLVVGGAVKLVTWLLRVAAGVEIPALDVLGSLGSIGVIVGAIYFLWKLIARVQRRLLWRVRRKLILSYMFVGVVPVLLVVAFFLLVGLLLFLNVGAYMVVGSIRGVADNTLLLAQTMAIDLAPSGGTDSRELLERKRASLARQYPEASIAVVPTSPEPCAGAAADVGAALPGPEAERARATKQRPAVVTVGPWAHLAAPKVLPAWVSCTGFAGLLAVSAPASQGEGGIGLMIRAAGLPRDPTPAFAVVIDIPHRRVPRFSLSTALCHPTGRFG